MCMGLEFANTAAAISTERLRHLQDDLIHGLQNKYIKLSKFDLISY